MDSLKIYYYDAQDPRRSATVRGGWWAKSQQEAEYWLREQGYQDIRCWEGSENTKQVGVDRFALALFFRQLAVLFNSGTTLDLSLELASHSEDRNMSAVAVSLAERVSQGFSLSQSMKTFPSVFSPIVRGMVASGEKSGSLARILTSLADAEERATKLENDLRAALAYPAVLSCVTLAVTVFFVFYILPMDRDLFGGLGIELPWVNRFMLKALDLVSSPIFLALCFGVAATIFLAWRQNSTRESISRVILRIANEIPVLGALLKEYRAARFLQVLNLILLGGGNIVLALQFMSKLATLPEEKKGLEQIRSSIMEGGDFGEALEGCGLFSRSISALLATGHEVGRLTSMSGRAQRICQENVQLHLEAAVALVEPLLMTLAGLVAGFVVITSALPLLQLVQKL